MTHKHKDEIRKQTREAQKAGWLRKGGCVISGCMEKAENHHWSYETLRTFVRMCRPHHEALHRGEVEIKAWTIKERPTCNPTLTFNIGFPRHLLGIAKEKEHER